MVTIYSLSCSNLNNPFRTKHLCSNDTILRILPTTLDIDLDLEHCSASAVFQSFYKHRYYFPYDRSYIYISIDYCFLIGL